MAIDSFLKLGDIKGESKDKEFKDCIDVLAWSWGMSQSGSMHIGGGGGSGKCSVNDLSVTKYVDSSTPNLMQKCMTGKHYDEATLSVRKAGDKPLVYLTIKMTDVLITSVSTGGSGGEDRLTENATLNFAKVKVEYTPQEKTGAGGGKINVTYNIEENAEE
ncbi:MAG: type VI secretion system tube protein Hcp [Rhodocyclaceae bacterium]|nr:type VI secretion system tube protein Hcp [Rhodocyclaceae bacterium]